MQISRLGLKEPLFATQRSMSSVSPTRNVRLPQSSSLLASFDQELAKLQAEDAVSVQRTSNTMRMALNPQAATFVPVDPSIRYKWKKPVASRAKTAPQEELKFPMYSWQAASPGAVLLYIRDEEQANYEVAKLRGPLGFDLEWRVIFARGALERKTSILQICDNTRILVIQLSEMHNFPVKVKEIVESPDVIKVGVNILGDGRKLQRDYGIVAGGLLELSHLANVVDPAQVPTKRMMSLQKIVEMYTGYTLSKGAVRTSNWEADLTPEQLEYAANDAHSALTVYTKLIRMADENDMDMTPIPNPTGMGISYILDSVVDALVATSTVESTTNIALSSKPRSKSSTSAKFLITKKSAPLSSSSSTTSTTTATTTSQLGLQLKRPILTATSVTSVDDSNYEYFIGRRTWTTSTFPQNSRPDSAPPPSQPPVVLKPLSLQVRRAYELWHVHNYEIADICAALRSPDNPLTKGTVINYVMNAIKSDRSLVYSRERLKQLVRADSAAWERHRWWLDQQ